MGLQVAQRDAARQASGALAFLSVRWCASTLRRCWRGRPLEHAHQHTLLFSAGPDGARYSCWVVIIPAAVFCMCRGRSTGARPSETLSPERAEGCTI
jgi:hypothetical protein